MEPDYKRLIASLFRDVKASNEDPLDRLVKAIKQSKYVCVFGAGMTAAACVPILRDVAGIQVDFLCDNDPNKWGKTFFGDLRCISPEELEGFKDEVAVIIETIHLEDVRRQLREAGFKSVHSIGYYRVINGDYYRNPEKIGEMEEQLMGLHDLLFDEESRRVLHWLVRKLFVLDPSDGAYSSVFSRDTYYPPEVIKLSEHEVFVDGGAYDGDSLRDFIDRTGGKFDLACCFEIDSVNFARLEQAVGRLAQVSRDKVRLFNSGLFDSNEPIGYAVGATNGQNTCIAQDTETPMLGNVVRLSDVMRGERPTFIKMDIEGAELNALRGAEELIRLHKPKLAVCVYHRPAHLWEVPFYLKRLRGDYKFFLRHHSTLEYETVCYAV